VSLEESDAMRRKFTEIAMSIGAVGLLLLVLVSFDDRVRREFSLRWEQGPAVQATEFGYTAKNLAMVVVQAAKDQGLAHTPVLIFVFAGSVLFLFMVRT
jgi:hypothetical protein